MVVLPTGTSITFVENKTNVGVAAGLSIGKIIGVKANANNGNVGFEANFLGLGASIDVGKDGVQFKLGISSVNGDVSFENHVGLGLSLRGLDVNYGNGYYTKNTYSETEQMNSLNYGGIAKAFIAAAAIMISPKIGDAIIKNPQLIPRIG